MVYYVGTFGMLLLAIGYGCEWVRFARRVLRDRCLRGSRQALGHPAAIILLAYSLLILSKGAELLKALG